MVTMTQRCERCGRERSDNSPWVMRVMRGAVVGFLCPDDTTPLEFTEASVNESILDFGHDQRGRITAHARV